MIVRAPDSLFNAYLIGGRLWPQIRGGINASLFHVFVKTLEGKKQIEDLARSRLTDRQITASKTTMIQDHRKADIPTRSPILDSLLEKEWFLSKRALLVSLAYFKKGDGSGIDPQDFPEEHDLIQLSAALDFSLEGIRQLNQASELVHKAVFREHRDLSKLFTASFYRNANYGEEIDEIADRYQISKLDPNNRAEIGDLCCDKMRKILEAQLKTTPFPHEWMTWSFAFKRNRYA